LASTLANLSTIDVVENSSDTPNDTHYYFIYLRDTNNKDNRDLICTKLPLYKLIHFS